MHYDSLQKVPNNIRKNLSLDAFLEKSRERDLKTFYTVAASSLIWHDWCDNFILDMLSTWVKVCFHIIS